MIPRKFTVPATDKIANPSTMTETAQVKAFIGDLPFADSRSLCRSLLDALALLNRHPKKVTNRAAIMQYFQTPCSRLVRIRPDRPGNPESRLMRQLLVEMGYGYKHLINDALRPENLLKSHKQLTRALYFAAKHLSLELFIAFEAYDCKVGNSWRELVAIYRLAEQQNLHQVQVEDPDLAAPSNATLSHVLKRILMLRAHDPSRMVSGEARACYDYFNSLASLAQLSPADLPEKRPGRYLLDFNSLKPPRPASEFAGQSGGDQLRILNLFPVSQRVHEDLQDMKLRKAEPPEGLQGMRELKPTLVLQRILLAWHDKHERIAERQEVFGVLLCAFGLGAVNHFLNDSLTRPEQQKDQDDADLEVNLESERTGSNRPARYLQIQCRQVNRSQSGICLRLQLPSDVKPKVGQVLLIQTNDQQQQFLTGIVRRRQQLEDQTLESGIQLIQGRVLPIGLRIGGGGQPFQPCLWVSRGEKRNHSILAPSGHFKPGQEVEVDVGLPAKRLTLQNKVEEMPSFVRFRFSS